MSTWPECLKPPMTVVDPLKEQEYQFDGWSDGHANLINKEGKVERWTYYDVKKSLNLKIAESDVWIDDKVFHIKVDNVYKRRGERPGLTTTRVTSMDTEWVYHHPDGSLCVSMRRKEAFVQEFDVPFTYKSDSSDENPSPLKTLKEGSFFGPDLSKPWLFNAPSELSVSAIAPPPPPPAPEMTKEQLRGQSVHDWIKYCHPILQECYVKLDMVTDLWDERDGDLLYSGNQKEIMGKFSNVFSALDELYGEALNTYKEKHFKN